MDRDKNFLLPKYVLELYSQLHQTKPFPSIWDFGFVDKSALESNKNKPYFEILDSNGKQQEIYFHTPEYDIYIIHLIDSFELFLLYDSERKDSVILASTKLKKHKIKFEE